MLFKKILIANRGEIACRIIRTARRLGIQTVAVYSEADATAQHVRLADFAYPIGGPRPADSYLRGDAIIEVAKKSGAQAIHPGYGFLSENPDFAEAAEQAGIVFIGPSANSMRKMGSKAGAKELMSGHGVPVVPGYTGEDQNPALLAREAQRIGFPLMIKAAYGGGGKGMRIVRKAEEFAANLESCQREAKSAFGRDRVLLERYVETPRHIEFQIFGDKHGNAIHLNERECSAQRRYQKVLEETPSPFMTPELRAKMGDAAIAAARALDYVNAGTVEFIVGPQGDFYFMEINTRLQVEHPVTEMVLHLDLVELQLRVAAGEALPPSLLRNKSVPQDGHAIELRLYAEDPQQGFLPGSGKLQRLSLPRPGTHVRIDSGVIEGDTVTIFYDPMIAKLIVWDRDRGAALQRMRDALAECAVVGPKSNIDFLERLVRHPAVVEGRIDTGYLDRHLAEFLPADAAPDHSTLFAAATAVLLDEEAAVPQLARASGDPYSPWARADAWRIGHSGKRIVCFAHADQRIEVDAHGAHGRYELSIGEARCLVANARLADGFLNAEFDGEARRFRGEVDADGVLLHDGERRARLARVAAFAYAKSAQTSGDRVAAPMPGRIVLVKVKAGDSVAEGQELIVMEAMKMEITLKAPRACEIDSVNAKPGEFVEADAVLVRFKV
ncbi:MAG: acetyl/propionyl/methylcrotonyl-CoA carboxylase subunit alpha [Rudaea sp.]|uniref:acetyl/propionyl/methylcrotonyl-CoA carboxylase subunit alpha n=1 Tax=unclassified Rudaea TaxID=2627037 RepID=UPI0010F8842E|nr:MULTISPECIES: acetyl/propionyl/methylcrotonyl-CoA carboxylase subunit alpha [unclassified Rudaea]MBN8887829.1 acetyl/propionyl/methylcrotonyl-CoA carboxylase subunit alpha [Rudaea sp.]